MSDAVNLGDPASVQRSRLTSLPTSFLADNPSQTNPADPACLSKPSHTTSPAAPSRRD